MLGTAFCSNAATLVLCSASYEQQQYIYMYLFGNRLFFSKLDSYVYSLVCCILQRSMTMVKLTCKIYVDLN